MKRRLKKILKIFLIVLVIFTAFSFWMSPRLGGLIEMGKDRPDQSIEQLSFSTERMTDINLVYNDVSDREDLIELRETYQLDSIIKDAKSDFEKVVKIQSWVQSRWKHDGDNPAEEASALYILKEAEKGRRFRCVEYSVVAGQCLHALGFKIRGLGLMTKDIDDVKYGGGHVVNEVFLEDVNKWVFIDPQFDVMTTLNGVPMNAVELQNAIVNNKDFEILNPNKTTTKEDYAKWIGPYLYYFNTSINGQRVTIWDRIVGNKKQLLLLPKGAEEPSYFQKIFRLNNFYYTNSVADFYPKA